MATCLHLYMQAARGSWPSASSGSCWQLASRSRRVGLLTGRIGRGWGLWRGPVRAAARCQLLLQLWPKQQQGRQDCRSVTLARGCHSHTQLLGARFASWWLHEPFHRVAAPGDSAVVRGACGVANQGKAPPPRCHASEQELHTAGVTDLDQAQATPPSLQHLPFTRPTHPDLFQLHRI